MTHPQIISTLQFVVDLCWLPLFIAACIAVIVFGSAVFGPKESTTPKWEAVQDHKGNMWRVRWSQPDEHGLYFYVRHYSGPVADCYARRDAEEFNRSGRVPSYPLRRHSLS